MSVEDEDRDVVVPRLLESGRIGEAIEFCHSISEAWQRAESLNSIARAILEQDSSTALSLWTEAIAVAEQGELTEDPQDSHDCASVLSEIAKDISASGNSSWAVDVAVSIRNDYIRDRTMRDLEEIEQSSD